MDLTTNLLINEENMGNAMSTIYGIIDKILSYLSMRDVNKCAVLNSVWRNSVSRTKLKRCQLFSTYYEVDITKKEFKEKFRQDLDKLWIEPNCFILFFYPTKFHDYKWTAYKTLTSYLPRTCSTIALQTYGIIETKLNQTIPPIVKCELIVLPKIQNFSAIPFYIFGETSTEFLRGLVLRDSDIVLNIGGDIVWGHKDALSAVKLFFISFDKNYDDSDESDEDSEVANCSLSKVIPKQLIQKYQAVVAGYISFCPKVSSFCPIAQGLAFCGSTLAVSSTVLTCHISSRSRISHSLDLLNEHFDATKEQPSDRGASSSHQLDAGEVIENNCPSKLTSSNTTPNIDTLCNKQIGLTTLEGMENNCSNSDNMTQSISSIGDVILCENKIVNDVLSLDASTSNIYNETQCRTTRKANKELLSFALMISCISRPDVLKRDKGVNNIDLVIFKEKFPKLPVFGYSAGGEIGHNHLHKQRKGTQKIDIPQCIHHSFSTVFVILSLYASKI